MNSKLWSCLTHNHIDFHSRFHVTWSYSMQEANNESWDIDKAGSLDVRAGVGSGCFSVESFSPMIAEAHSHCEQPKWASRLGTSIHECQVINLRQPQEDANVAEARRMWHGCHFLDQAMFIRSSNYTFHWNHNEKPLWYLFSPAQVAPIFSEFQGMVVNSGDLLISLLYFMPLSCLSNTKCAYNGVYYCPCGAHGLLTVCSRFFHVLNK